MKLLPIAIVITVVVALLLSGPAAIGATQWFVFKTLFFVEFLFASVKANSDPQSLHMMILSGIY